MNARALLLSLSLLVAACAPAGFQRLSPENVARIKKGVTTQSEVEAMLGKPYMRNHNEDGSVSLSYMKGTIGLPIFLDSYRLLTVIVGRNGYVADLKYTDMRADVWRYDIYHYPH